MGSGSYSAADWNKLKVSRGISNSSTYSDMYAKAAKEKYLPNFFEYREARDCDDSPESTPIIIALDDTASMGYLATEMAKGAIHETITQIIEKKPVTNPQVLCGLFGNFRDIAPLQVTQFESDIRIVEQLLDLYIELHGSGYSGDSYVWYFAAKHTKLDCFEKRGEKGFLFTIGDDFCDINMTADSIQKVFNEKVGVEYTPEELIEMASEKYTLYHIVIAPINDSIAKQWKDLMGDHAVVIEDNNASIIPQLITSIMQIERGRTKESVIAQWDADTSALLNKILKDMKSKPNAVQEELEEDASQASDDSNANDYVYENEAPSPFKSISSTEESEASAINPNLQDAPKNDARKNWLKRFLNQ